MSGVCGEEGGVIGVLTFLGVGTSKKGSQYAKYKVISTVAATVLVTLIIALLTLLLSLLIRIRGHPSMRGDF